MEARKRDDAGEEEQPELVQAAVAKCEDVAQLPGIDRGVDLGKMRGGQLQPPKGADRGHDGGDRDGDREREAHREHEQLQPHIVRRQCQYDGDAEQRQFDQPVSANQTVREPGMVVDVSRDRFGIEAERTVDRKQRLVLQRPIQLARDIAERSDDDAGENDLSDRAERKQQLRVGKLAFDDPVAIGEREQDRSDRQRHDTGDRFEAQAGEGEAERQQAAHGCDGKPVQMEELPGGPGVRVDHAAPRWDRNTAAQSRSKFKMAVTIVVTPSPNQFATFSAVLSSRFFGVTLHAFAPCHPL